MRKIPSLFVRNHDGDRLVREEVVDGSEWVIRGEGLPTVKFDGTAAMVKGGRLYRRHDYKAKAREKGLPPPDGWEPCEAEPNEHTGHWPGWLPVGSGPEDRYYAEAMAGSLPDGTYELIGPKVQGNPYGLQGHVLMLHGYLPLGEDPRSFRGIKDYLSREAHEGIVWHHPDGRMVKIKARDFGIQWPREKERCQIPSR